MATLKLSAQQSAKFAERNAVRSAAIEQQGSLVGKYVIFCRTTSSKAYRFTCFQPTREIADAEAARLKTASPHMRFVVLLVDSEA